MTPLQILGLFLLSIFQVIACLVVSVSVPSARMRGDSAALLCDYSLEGAERLYSVKWYRDNEEFYRYVPRLRPPQRSYGIDGIDVNMEKSSARRVQLQSVTLRSRGVYRCEVSAEAPSFYSAQAEAHMEVYYLPKESPSISGHERRYRVGELLDVNCTSALAFPAPELHWYINDKMVTEAAWLAPHGWWHAARGLVAARLGLRAPAAPRMRLRCVAALAAQTRDHTVLLEASASCRRGVDGTVHVLLLLHAGSALCRLRFKLSHRIT